MSMYYCVQCEHTLPAFSKFCMYCGTATESQHYENPDPGSILDNPDLLAMTSNNLQRLHQMLTAYKQTASLPDDVLEMDCSIDVVHYVLLKYLIQSYTTAAYGYNTPDDAHESLSEEDTKELTLRLASIFLKESRGEFKISLEHYMSEDQTTPLRDPDLLTWLQLQLYRANDIPAFTNTWTVKEVKTSNFADLLSSSSAGDIPF